jgi:hypothetical protein
MIRPFTLICLLLACGSGLYLYSAKHRVQMIDREIEKTVRATDDLREQSRVLHAEWTLQNDPQRLQALADQFLNLKTVTPGQFTSMADLDSRLPAVPAPEPPAPEQQPVPVAQAPQPEELPPPAPPPAAAVSPPRPVAPVVAAAPSQPRPAAAVIAQAPPVPHPPEHKTPSRPVVAEAPLPPPSVPHRTVVAESPRLTLPASVPLTGSALGMARNTSVPLPRPVPVSASQWGSQGGGG